MAARSPKNAPTSRPKSAPKTAPCGRALSTESPGGVQPLAELTARLDAYVAEKNLNRSEARVKILETIVQEGRHFRPQELFDHLRRRFPEVGKATLYRVLPMLVECGILQEGPAVTGGEAIYELADEDHHDHIVCLDCRKIFEFHDKGIETRQDAITSQLGFTAESHRHVIYARCDRLKK